MLRLQEARASIEDAIISLSLARLYIQETHKRQFNEQASHLLGIAKYLDYIIEDAKTGKERKAAAVCQENIFDKWAREGSPHDTRVGR